MKQIRHFFHYFDISGQSLLLFGTFCTLCVGVVLHEYWFCTLLGLWLMGCWQVISAMVRGLTGDTLKGIYFGVALLYCTTLPTWVAVLENISNETYRLLSLAVLVGLPSLVAAVWYFMQCLLPTPTNRETLPLDGIVPNRLELLPAERLERKWAKYLRALR